jgi:hypothetical protein
MRKHDDPVVKAAWDYYIATYYSPAPEKEKLAACAAWRTAYNNAK